MGLPRSNVYRSRIMSNTLKVPTRRETTTIEVGPFTVLISFVPYKDVQVPVEVFFLKRGNKAGDTELDKHLYELGTKISKEMQGKINDK